MNVSKPWLIVVVLAAGVAYLWFWDDDSQPPKEVSEQPAPRQPIYGTGYPPRRGDIPGDNRAATWGSGNHQPQGGSRYAMPSGSFAPPPERSQGPLSPEGYRFRPQEGMADKETRWKPPVYESVPSQGMPARPSAITGFDGLEQNYGIGSAGTGYRFRPQDSTGRSKRWTGNYYSAPGSAPLAPTNPQPPHQYPMPWQQNAPASSGNPLWADTRVAP
jgi:hypothetical protein